MKDEKKRVNKALGRQVVGRAGNFAGSCDEITFGVRDGRPFHTANSGWPTRDQVRWAEVNALFFRGVAERLEEFAGAVEKDLGEDRS